ncbi:class I SAM-dependent methyltransferase [Methanosarcina barkeri]|uniref:class I SAM-dependent methyltransferase n=1 Tax=Methanosarcina barkeri TaxID=2208 RepID=UPI001FB49D5F|nr:class I SAM-dependent methyltransferase [Methanosarcina barkeri]
MQKNLPEGSVLGIDLSEEMITFARNHYSQEKFPNLAFMQANASELTFDSEFDIVFSNAVLHWIKVPEAALKGFFEKPQTRWSIPGPAWWERKRCRDSQNS